MYSSKETPKPAQNKSILLIGPPGGGKTTLAMQFPSVMILDCDLNLDGPEKFLRKKNPDLAYWYEQVPRGDDGKPIEVWQCYDRLMLKLNEVKTIDAVKTVVIDSLTLINEYVIRKVLKEQSKTEMEPRHWQPFKTLLLNLLIASIRGLGKDTIVTCHESILTKPAGPDKVMQEIVVAYKPSVQGSITDYLGGLFTDVWRCTSELAPGGKVEFKLTTRRTAQSDLKNSCEMPGEILDPTYEKLKQYL